MALTALAADKGSPGVTTAAVALAAVWPRRVLLAEADPVGGALVYGEALYERSPGGTFEGSAHRSPRGRRKSGQDLSEAHIPRCVLRSCIAKWQEM
ncbi:hypothetical protein SUDANB51_04775 [Streptomyces sp. enrichment culture]